MNLSFTFDGDGEISWLKAISEGMPVELTNPMTVKTYSTFIFSAADGYTLENMTCDVTGVEVLRSIEANTYEVTVTSADVTAAEFNVTVREMQPAEGNSIAVTETSFWYVSGK